MKDEAKSNEELLVEIKSLQKRIAILESELTQKDDSNSLDDVEDVEFADMFDLDDIQKLQDEFAKATGVACMIMTTDGIPITKPSNFCRLCNDIIRKTEKGRENCYRSDASFGHPNATGPIIAPCTSAGLWDAGTSIIVEGKHVANWLIGQVRDQTQSEELIRSYAREIGADEEEAAKAFYEVPAMSKEKFTQLSQVLYTLAKQLSTIAYQNLQLRRSIEERKLAEAALLESEERFRNITESSQDLLYRQDFNTGQLEYVSPSSIQIVGYTPDQLMSRSLDQQMEDFHPDDLPSRANFREDLLLAMRTGKQFIEREFRLKNRDGEYRWIRGNYQLTKDTDGNVQFIVGALRDITDRKEAEINLKESEQKFRAVFNNTFEFMGIMSPDGILTAANQTALDFVHQKESEVVGKLLWETTWWEYDTNQKDKIKEAVQKAASGQTVRMEVTNQDSGGQLHYIDLSIKPVYDESGKIVFLIPEGREITDRKNIEQALRESESRFRFFLDSSPDMLFLKDMDLRYVLLNKANALYFGADEKQLIGKTDYDLMPEDNARECEASDRKALETRRIVIGIEQVEGRTYETRKIPVFDNDKPLGVAGIIRDITDQVEQESKYTKIIETTPDGYWMLKMEGYLIDANQAAAEMLEYSLDELIGMHVSQIDALDDTKQFKARIGAVTNDGIPPFESVHRTKSGKLIDVELIGTLIQLKDGPAVIAFTRDISERKKSEQEKAKLEEQLRQSQKMEAVGRLAGGVAHDFNNILTGITGYTEMIQSVLGVGDPIYQDLEEVRKAAERASGLTSQLLAFSRKQIIDPKIIQPNDIIQNSQKMLARIIGEDIDLIFSPARELWSIKADTAQLDQILINLAVNARDAMPEGGRLTIETQNIEIDADYCKSYPEIIPGDFVMLAVSDSGHGMDEEVLKHIFEPFYSTKAKDAGTGLGLSTVYGIMKQNKGFINVYSELGMGSTFKIYFPAIKEKAEQRTRQEECKHSVGTETVLLVEDEEMVRRLAKKILEKHGYRVIAHESGGQALVYCEKNKEDIDLLLTDVIMPGMNGKELHERLKEKRPELQALFMSGYTEDVIAHHGVLDEGTDFIQKPFSIDSLTRKVRDVLDRKD